MWFQLFQSEPNQEDLGISLVLSAFICTLTVLLHYFVCTC